MYDIDDLDAYIELGHQGEKGVTEIEFDVTDWLDEYPTGTLNITYTRPTETTVYPVDVTGVSLASPTSGNLALSLADAVNILTWTISDVVTEISGGGTFRVQLSQGGTIKKMSDLVQSIVIVGHGTTSTPPSPLADWIAEWGAIDLAVTSVAPEVPANGAITQDETGTHIVLEIPDGAAGEPGTPGEPGDTPVRGVDYWTAEDIAAIEAHCEDYIDTEILGGSS